MRGVTTRLWSARGILVKLTAAHQPPNNVGRLQHGAFLKWICREVASNRDEDMPVLVCLPR